MRECEDNNIVKSKMVHFVKSVLEKYDQEEKLQ